MGFADGVSSSTRSASASHQAKYFSMMSAASSLRIASRCSGGAVAWARSIRNRPPMSALEEVVVDGVRVEDERALVAGEQRAHDLGVLLRRVREQDVPLRRGDHEEMAVPALLLRLHEDASGIGAEVRRRERVVPHASDER